MKTRRSSCKKSNQFEILSEATEESKAPDVVDTCSVTVDQDDKTSETVSDLRVAVNALENKTTAQYSNLEFAFWQMTDSIKELHTTITSIDSRQNSATSTTQTSIDLAIIDENTEDTDTKDAEVPTATDPDDDETTEDPYMTFPQATSPSPVVTGTINPSGPTMNHQFANAPTPGISNTNSQGSIPS